jgi:hypothetical protein
MFDLTLASVGAVAGFMAVTFIGYKFLRKQRRENETFARNNAEDAMRVKAKQYENN